MGCAVGEPSHLQAWSLASVLSSHQFDVVLDNMSPVSEESLVLRLMKRFLYRETNLVICVHLPSFKRITMS
eukprot:m.65658 g.65658  ORF g.65658 m.65658 type:complete len:71 (-) comp13552_c0_seq1:1753-1965(-)